MELSFQHVVAVKVIIDSVKDKDESVKEKDDSGSFMS